jgi:hypothetical protein
METGRDGGRIRAEVDVRVQRSVWEEHQGKKALRRLIWNNEAFGIILKPFLHGLHILQPSGLSSLSQALACRSGNSANHLESATAPVRSNTTKHVAGPCSELHAVAERVGVCLALSITPCPAGQTHKNQHHTPQNSCPVFFFAAPAPVIREVLGRFQRPAVPISGDRFGYVDFHRPHQHWLGAAARLWTRSVQSKSHHIHINFL